MRVLLASLLVVALASCLSVQDYGGNPPPDASTLPDGSADASDAGSTGPIGEDDDASRPNAPSRWTWVNPAPTGRTLVAIGGTSPNDIWVAGEAGTVAHWTGARWDLLHNASAETRFFAIGTKQPNDVWIAGRTNDQIGVVHFDGKEWTNSYPFAAANFRLFSHGTGKRLFAVVDWDVLELVEGKWERTDTSANDVFGPPADVWVGPSGEAWLITSGAKLLELPAGSKKWELQGPVTPSGSVGLAISGACAFYTGRSSGAGFLHFDGSRWQPSPTAEGPITLDTTPHGSLSACLGDGTGIFAAGDWCITASASKAPTWHYPTDFAGQRFLGALSFDGSKAYSVGALGAFLTRTASTGWKEEGPTIRKNLYGVDVGTDGTVMLVDALQPDRNDGGEVLFFENGKLTTRSTSGFAAPSVPYGVTVLGKDDAWVLADGTGGTGVAHWTGKWSVTRFLGGPGPLAIWAPAKDDVWVTAQAKAWHYDGSDWNGVPVEASYRSIHGTGPNDVWFAGDGVAHWDGTKLTRIASITGRFTGVWAAAPDRIWLWGDEALLFDGKKTMPVTTALNAGTEWDVRGIAESTTGDLFVLTKRGTGTSLLWFDPSHEKLLEQVPSDLELSLLRGRGTEIWAVGAGGASLRFAPPQPR